MRTLLFCAALALVSPAWAADPMADAAALVAKKDYAKAIDQYVKLADKGNADAQLRLGELYLNEDSGLYDEAKAETWLRKAAEKGQSKANESIQRIEQRAKRKSEIEYWTAKYDGRELIDGKYMCPLPRLPSVSKLNDEIDAINARLQRWQDCYNGMVVNLNKSKPLTQKIPADLAALMTKAETAKAEEYLGEVHKRISERAKVQAKLLLADVSAWRDATDAYMAEHNRIVKENAKIPKDD